ncbi:MAG: Gfo/Idh/MocA family oxidoreductase, partial [Hyphomicrobiaceae bacterium]
MSIRYGLIGGGMMGQEHIRNLSLLKGAEVTAVADPDEAMRELSARLAGPATRAYADYRELISEDICDAFIIASPND